MGDCKDCNETQNKGNRGPRGYRGEQGPAGPAGTGTSVTGPMGPRGFTGLNGSNGLNGLSAYGVWLLLPGNAGKTESEFIDSIKGDTGPIPTILIGSVTAGAVPGVTSTTVGTTITLDFVLAQGPQGDPGNTGGDGPQGPAAPNSLIFKRDSAIATLGAWTDNTGNYETITEIKINKTSMLGYTGTPATALNADDWTAGIMINSIIQVTSLTDSSKFGIYKVTGITDLVSHVAYAVIKIAANGLSSTVGEEVAISYNIPGLNTVSASSVTIPIGVVWPIATKDGKALPTGWLLCDGSAYNVATYPDLFAEIGTSFSQPGDPLTVFRVPNLVDSIPYGCIDGNVGNIVGNNTTTGTVSVNINAANLPEHTHGLSAVTVSGGAHGHEILADQDSGSGSSQGLQLTQDPPSAFDAGAAGWISDGEHTHTISGTVDAEGIPGINQAVGVITGGDNRQASVSMRYMIKY